MKLAFVSLAALVSVAMAAPGTPEVSEVTRSKFDGNSKYSISGFRPSFSKIDECCLRNAGGYDFDMERVPCIAHGSNVAHDSDVHDSIAYDIITHDSISTTASPTTVMSTTASRIIATSTTATSMTASSMTATSPTTAPPQQRLFRGLATTLSIPL
ncbi:hypothetical protein BG005_008254 [Podila minutissima]|nr:hypothetical protein BG005_008254 [Podila minutissima]